MLFAGALLAWGTIPAGRAAPIVDAGFEAGLTAPWGTGRYSAGRPIWWNRGGCRSVAVADETVVMRGIASLHVVNPTPRAPNVYGTTAQRIAIEPDRPCRITLWARGRDLASKGAVNIAVDDAWQVRPIALPAGTYSWTRLSGTFSLPSNHAEIRIIAEDRGEAWLDDIRVTPLDEQLY